MSIAEDLTIIAENVPIVHQVGYAKGEGDFWDVVQRSGARTFYEYGFAYWDSEYLHPKHKVIPKNCRTISMFQTMRYLKIVEKEYFDLSQCTYSDTTSTQGNYTTFRGCNKLQTIEDVGMQSGYYYQTFNTCESLETIEIFRCNETTNFYQPFNKSTKIKNITLEGTIGQNNFDISMCPDLTEKSIISIVSALSENLTASKTITLPKTAVRTHFPNDNSIAGAEWSNVKWSSLIEKKTNWNFAFN